MSLNTEERKSAEVAMERLTDAAAEYRRRAAECPERRAPRAASLLLAAETIDLVAAEYAATLSA